MSRTIRLEVYGDQTSANMAAGAMARPPANMTVEVKEAKERLIYDNAMENTEEVTLPRPGKSVWLVIGTT